MTRLSSDDIWQAIVQPLPRQELETQKPGKTITDVAFPGAFEFVAFQRLFRQVLRNCAIVASKSRTATRSCSRTQAPSVLTPTAEILKPNCRALWQDRGLSIVEHSPASAPRVAAWCPRVRSATLHTLSISCSSIHFRPRRSFPVRRSREKKVCGWGEGWPIPAASCLKIRRPAMERRLQECMQVFRTTDRMWRASQRSDVVVSAAAAET